MNPLLEKISITLLLAISFAHRFLRKKLMDVETLGIEKKSRKKYGGSPKAPNLAKI